MSQGEITNLARRKDKHKKFRAARASGGDARFFSLAPDAGYDLTITETGSGADVTALETLYPSL